MLCRRLINSLGSNVQLAYLPNPYMGSQTLMLALAEELGLGPDIAHAAPRWQCVLENKAHADWVQARHDELAGPDSWLGMVGRIGEVDW